MIKAYLKKPLILICFFIFNDKNSSAKPDPLLEKTYEHKLPSFISEKLLKDTPFVDLAFDEDFWLLGKKNLWKWNLKNNQLRKTNLHNSWKKNQTKKIFISNKKIFIVFDHGVVEITKKPFRIFKHTAKKLRREPPLMVAKEDKNTLIWLTKHSIRRFQIDNKKISVQSIKLPPKTTKVILSENKKYLWFIGNKNILKAPLKTPRKVTKVFTGDSNFIDLLYDKKNQLIFSHNRYSGFIFSPSGKLVQSLPVTKNHRIAAMTLSSQHHVYLFSDRILEMYSKNTKTPRYYHLDFGYALKVSKLISFSRFIALIIDNKPRLFELPRQTTTS